MNLFELGSKAVQEAEQLQLQQQQSQQLLQEKREEQEEKERQQLQERARLLQAPEAALTLKQSERALVQEWTNRAASFSLAVESAWLQMLTGAGRASHFQLNFCAAHWEKGNVLLVCREGWLRQADARVAVDGTSSSSSIGAGEGEAEGSSQQVVALLFRSNASLRRRLKKQGIHFSMPLQADGGEEEEKRSTLSNAAILEAAAEILLLEQTGVSYNSRQRAQILREGQARGLLPKDLQNTSHSALLAQLRALQEEREDYGGGEEAGEDSSSSKPLQSRPANSSAKTAGDTSWKSVLVFKGQRNIQALLQVVITSTALVPSVSSKNGAVHEVIPFPDIALIDDSVKVLFGHELDVPQVVAPFPFRNGTLKSNSLAVFSNGRAGLTLELSGIIGPSTAEVLVRTMQPLGDWKADCSSARTLDALQLGKIALLLK